MTKKDSKTRSWSSDSRNQLPPAAPLLAREFRELYGMYLNVYCYEQSRGTITTKRNVYDLLAFYAEWRHDGVINTETVSRFLHHVRHGHEDPEGRWGGTRKGSKFRKAVTPRTPQLYYDYLTRMFDTLVEIEELVVSPMRHLKRPTAAPAAIKPPPTDAVQQLLEQARKGNNPIRDEAMILLTYDSGLRREEVCNLRWKHVDTNACTVFVFDGKGNKSRMSTFSPLTAQVLIKYMRPLRKTNPDDEDYLFLNQYRYKGQPMKPEGMYRMMRRHADAAGIPLGVISPHKLRHGFATNWAMSGLPQKAIQAMLGHTTSTMTMRYQNFSEVELAKMTRSQSPVEQMMKKQRR